MVKKVLREWKSINDDVVTLSKFIANELMRYTTASIESRKTVVDAVVRVPYVSGSFDVDISNVFKDGKKHFGMDVLAVIFNCYVFYNESLFEFQKRTVGNSEYDSGLLILNVAVLRELAFPGQQGGYLDTSMVYEAVYHELSHALQYGFGMEKRKKLYDTAVEIIKTTDGNTLPNIMARLMYMTFPHEQDSFANQFYGMLTSSKGEPKPFQQAVKSFGYLGMFNNLIKDYKKALKSLEDENELRAVLRAFKFDLVQFKKRIHFGYKRFVDKLDRVYTRYVYEYRRKHLTAEGHMAETVTQSVLLEEYRKYYDTIIFDEVKKNW